MKSDRGDGQTFTTIILLAFFCVRNSDYSIVLNNVFPGIMVSEIFPVLVEIIKFWFFPKDSQG